MIQNVNITFDLGQSEIIVMYDERMDELVALFLNTEKFREAGFSVRLPGRYLGPIDCAMVTTGAPPPGASDANPCTPEASAPITLEASALSAPAPILSDDNGPQASPVTPTELDPSVSLDSLYAEDPLIDHIPGSDVSVTPPKRARVIYDNDSSESDSSESCCTPTPVAGEKPSGRPRGSPNRKSVRKDQFILEKSQLRIEPEVVLKELERLESNSEVAVINAYLGQSDLGDPIACDGGYQCGECHEIFKHYNATRRHMITHLSVKPYSCMLCKAAFGRKANLQSHLAGHLRRNESKHKISVKKQAVLKKSQVCIEPEVVLKELERLKSDSETAAVDAYLEQSDLRPLIKCDGGYQCCECREIFNGPQNARRHMLTHLSVGPYSCILCKAAFGRKANLQSHLAGYLRRNGSKQKISVKEQLILKHPDMAEFMQEMCSLLSKYTHQDVFHVCAALVKQRWPEFEINKTHARPHGWPNEVPHKGLDTLHEDHLVLLASIMACKLDPDGVVIALAIHRNQVPCNLRESIEKLKGCRLSLTPEQNLFCASLLAYGQTDLAHLCIKLVAGLLGREQARYPYLRGIRPPLWPADVRFASPYELTNSLKVCLASKIASQLTPDELNSALTSNYQTKNGRGQIKLADEMVERLNSVKRQALGLN